MDEGEEHENTGREEEAWRAKEEPGHWRLEEQQGWLAENGSLGYTRREDSKAIFWVETKGS